MNLFRKTIYIGEASEGAVYFDTKENQALLAPKSRLLDTQKANKMNRLIPVLVLVLITGAIGLFLNGRKLFTGHYTVELLFLLSFIWLLEFTGMVFLIEKALYKNVTFAKPTNRDNFRIAAYGHLLWNTFNDKKVTKGKKIFACFIIVFLIFIFISLIFLGFIWLKGDVEVVKRHKGLLGAPIGSEIVGFSLFGILPAVVVLVLWQNNPFRFFKAVETYQKRKIKWSKNNE